MPVVLTQDVLRLGGVLESMPMACNMGICLHVRRGRSSSVLVAKAPSNCCPCPYLGAC